MMASFFIAHGSPMLAIQDNAYTRDLKRLGEQLGRPEAIVLFSAHWVSGKLTLTSTDETYETIYDFGGFPRQLYEVVYPAKGSTRVSNEVRQLLETHGFEVTTNSTRGLDHGAWVILRHMFPSADIPVILVSVNPTLPPERQYNIGKALEELRERNIVVIGSGATVHNFSKMAFHEPERTDPWAKEFDDWLIDRIKGWDTASLFAYEQLAPHARSATPDYEHFLPIFIAMGAGNKERKAELLHQSYQYGSLSHLILKFE